MAAAAEIHAGGCLCGAVRFEVSASPVRVNHCHCTLCRRHSGGTGLAQARIPRAGFRLLQGEDLITVYRPPSGVTVKAFCSVCGASLFGLDWPEGDDVAIRLSAFDDDPFDPEFHQWVSAKARWERLPDDGLPRHPEGVPLR